MVSALPVTAYVLQAGATWTIERGIRSGKGLRGRNEGISLQLQNDGSDFRERAHTLRRGEVGDGSVLVEEVDFLHSRDVLSTAVLEGGGELLVLVGTRLVISLLSAALASTNTGLQE